MFGSARISERFRPAAAAAGAREPFRPARHLNFQRVPLRRAKMRNAQSPSPGSQELTLLELTGAVIEVAASDREVVATLAHLIRSGKVRLTNR